MYHFQDIWSLLELRNFANEQAWLYFNTILFLKRGTGPWFAAHLSLKHKAFHTGKFSQSKPVYVGDYNFQNQTPQDISPHVVLYLWLSILPLRSIEVQIQAIHDTALVISAVVSWLKNLQADSNSRRKGLVHCSAAIVARNTSSRIHDKGKLATIIYGSSLGFI